MSRNKFYVYSSLNAIHEHGLNPESREIYFHGHEHDESSEIEHRSTSKLIKNIHFLERQNSSPIVIYLLSEGGSIYDGYAIYDVIKNATSYITIVCCGYAHSMASIILQAADTRVVMPNCVMIIHHGMVLHEGTPKSLFANAEENKRQLSRSLDIYAEKMVSAAHFEGRNVNYVRRWLDNKLKNVEDWYLHANEIIDFGLADCIYGEDKCNLGDFFTS